MVSLGGAWHSEEEDEETLLTNPKSRPDRHKTELGRGSCHRDEECEEALATRLKIPAQLPPQPPGQLTQAGQAGFWPKRGAWTPGLLTFLLSVPRPPAQLCFLAIWPRFWVGQQGLLTILLRVPRSPRCHRFEEVSF